MIFSSSGFEQRSLKSCSRRSATIYSSSCKTRQKCRGNSLEETKNAVFGKKETICFHDPNYLTTKFKRYKFNLNFCNGLLRLDQRFPFAQWESLTFVSNHSRTPLLSLTLFLILWCSKTKRWPLFLRVVDGLLPTGADCNFNVLINI